MKKVDKLLAQDRRTHSMVEYENAINSFIGENQNKEDMKEDVKLAKVLRFYIEFYGSIRDKERYDFIGDVLDYYTNIVPNKNDIFQRPTIEFHIPAKIRKLLYKGFVEFNKNREIELKKDAEELLLPLTENEKLLKTLILEEYKKQLLQKFLEQKTPSASDKNKQPSLEGEEIDLGND